MYLGRSQIRILADFRRISREFGRFSGLRRSCWDYRASETSEMIVRQRFRPLQMIPARIERDTRQNRLVLKISKFIKIYKSWKSQVPSTLDPTVVLSFSSSVMNTRVFFCPRGGFSYFEQISSRFCRVSPFYRAEIICRHRKRCLTIISDVFDTR